MLDEGRHFFGKEYIKQCIDYLAMNKMNVFHWHFTESAGWRIEIKKYPKLSEVGAWRVDRSGIPYSTDLRALKAELLPASLAP